MARRKQGAALPTRLGEHNPHQAGGRAGGRGQAEVHHIKEAYGVAHAACL